MLGAQILFHYVDILELNVCIEGILDICFNYSINQKKTSINRKKKIIFAVFLGIKLLYKSVWMI